MKNLLLIFGLCSFIFSGVHQTYAQNSNIGRILQDLQNADSDQVLVVAHRGMWREAPENSLLAIEKSIALGVDMVEIDVRETKDGHLVLMHDETIDRTTNATGKVTEWSLDSLKTVKLRNGLDRVTEFGIPTLEEALLVSRGKILLNLDKSYDYFEKIYPLLKKTETADHVVMKGRKSLKEFQADFGSLADSVMFMPIVYLDQEGYQEVIDEYLENSPPVAFEFIFATEKADFNSIFSNVRKKGSRVWVNSLWPSLNAGHDDDRATYDLPGTYDWLIKRKVNMIQTDRPRYLLQYLRDKSLHE
ncbi:MAG: glycerophosphodiester phosphodiesterase [Bacteroidetes bacterium]|jgi:glycerophosphoryl diester phosphodiesterase|nr:glycerophosphodiester phosphodiesterase [Bacteroidota bacterium]